ncbi:hypothetical protein O181_061791 [Austropuccinia psidii MF-1]|uniref:C2H2-type domain-containing protein n=1 Tax=Austropuccinia psidii MF-1 TaxID=1389203 RepID=A0A9Q3EGU3_9BASI|nr:hypothetical protein [Austropuccinia psidii MF-1]
MTIVHKGGNIHKNADGLSIWALTNTTDNPAYFPKNSEPQISIEGNNITDVGTKFFEGVRESHKEDNNNDILNYLLDKDCKDKDLADSLDDIWKISHDNGRFHLFDAILYHGSKHTCGIVLCSRLLINTILLEFHEKIYSHNFSEDRKMKGIKIRSWWPSWRKYVIEYCNSCDRCQKANKATGELFGLIIHIQEPYTPSEVVCMDLVTTLLPGGNKDYNACIVTVDRYRKTPIFLPCHKDDTSI